jgi:putative phosphoesterase
MKTLVGVISDTHGLVRPEVLKIFAGVDQILHAGDIGKGGVIAQLEAIAPVTAVRGNVDLGQPWARQLNETEAVNIDGWRILLCHDRDQSADQMAMKHYDLVVYGPSHRPEWDDRGQENGPALRWLNPGSAGRRRFKLPVSVALLTVTSAALEVELINLL